MGPHYILYIVQVGITFYNDAQMSTMKKVVHSKYPTMHLLKITKTVYVNPLLYFEGDVVHSKEQIGVSESPTTWMHR